MANRRTKKKSLCPVARRVREPLISTLKGLGDAPKRRWSCTPEYDQTGTKLLLSDAQCQVFAKGPFLGSGAYATVFEHPTDDDKVVKFTTDAEDAKSAAVLKGKNLRGAVKVYDVAKLENITVNKLEWVGNDAVYVDKPVYGIVAERLNATNNAPKEVQAAIDAFSYHVSDEDRDYGPILPGPDFKLRPDFDKQAIERCTWNLAMKGHKQGESVCRKIIPKLQAALEEVGRKGGIFTPDLHAGNWGERPDGSFAILDFGVSRTDPSQTHAVESLAKAPVRRKRRRG